MSDTFVRHTIEHLIDLEGEYSDNPDDAGGPTRWGITQAVARNYGYPGDMKEFPVGIAYDIYLDIYWRKPGFAQVALMSQTIAEELFDSGVNMGPKVPTEWLQRWLNAMNRQESDYHDIKVDGTAGLATIGALRAYLNRRGSEGELVLATALNCSQGARYLELAEGREANETFLYGWLRNRVFGQLNELKPTKTV